MAKMPKLWLNDEEGFVYLSDLQGEPAMCRLATYVDLTAERVAAYLDRKAEGSNHHDFVGLHSYLVGLIEEKAGAECARAVMRVLLRHGGLHRVRGGR
jgi:uncharacterized protein YehS (DUF1456 family)